MSGAGAGDGSSEERKPFLDHLMEMRARIFISFLAVAVTTAVAWTFFGHVNAVLLAPLRKVSGGIEGAAGIYPPITLAVHEAFVYVLKTGLVVGVVLASPVVLYEIWTFVSPGLTRPERRALIPIFWLGLFFFVGGAAVCYFWVLPTAIGYLVQVTMWTGSELKTRLGDYASFVTGLLVAFGLAFEMPLVMLALSRTGIVSPRSMLAKWRHVTVGAFILGAFLTPPDYVTCVMMAACLLALYALGLVFAFLASPAEAPAGDATASQPPDKKD